MIYNYNPFVKVMNDEVIINVNYIESSDLVYNKDGNKSYYIKMQSGDQWILDEEDWNKIKEVMDI